MYNNGGKTVIGGGQSGLDTESIINSLVEAKRLPAANLETKNKAIDTKVTAYASLKSLITRFQSAADVLRNPPGVNNASKNIFEYRTASLTTNYGGSGDSYMGMTVQPGAAVQSFTINEISQLAKETKQESNVFTLPDTAASVVGAAGSTDPNQFAAGTFTLRNVTGGANVDITLAEDDSLATVVGKFNAVKDQTGVQATILKVGTGSPDSTYKIIFSATKTGETYGFDLGDAGTVLSDPSGVLANVSFNTTQTAQNAEFQIDGVTVERESNSVDDVIDGITFSLKQVTTGSTGLFLNASVTPDTDIAYNAITALADVYNEFRLFAAKQQELGDNGQPTEEAVLNNEQAMRTLISQVATEVTSIISGITGGNPARLADIGISFDNFQGDEENLATKNIMVVDAEKLKSALASNYEGVRQMFEFTMTSDNPNLSVFARTNSLNVTSMSLTIDRTNNIFRANYTLANGTTGTADFDMSVLDATSGTISLKGKDGTALAGLQLIYASNQDDTFNVKFTQGYGDRLYNIFGSALDATNGTITQAVNALNDQKERNTEEITKLDDYLVTYREQLTNKYATLEAALTQANQLLSLLEAQASARESS
jgi:flagellar hook-associated protein 2